MDGDRNEYTNEYMNEKVPLLYLVLVCDGVWDVMTNDEVGNFIVDKVNEKGSTDNMSVMIVALPSFQNDKKHNDGKAKDDTRRVLDFTSE